uniref:protein MMS22-like isoform X2 n=1 Tax=Myxine glutinosa TaxID=7769 RepID=UPI00358FFFA2
MSVPILLWDYYSKHLNSMFHVPHLDLAGTFLACSSPATLLAATTRCCHADVLIPPPAGAAGTMDMLKANSFELFLSVLASQLRHGAQGKQPSPWHLFKGRFYTKFHQRRLSELTDNGLHNFFFIFLVVARAISPSRGAEEPETGPEEFQEVTCRLIELLECMNPSSLSVGQRMNIWRGLFAVASLRAQHGHCPIQACRTLSVDFLSICREFLLCTTPPQQRAMLWLLLAKYLEWTQELMETGGLVGLEVLLGDGLALLLPACRAAELDTCLSFLTCVIAHLRRIQHSVGLARTLWKSSFPFVRDRRLFHPSPTLLPDVAAGFAKLSLCQPTALPSDLSPHPVLELCRLFAWDDLVPAVTACRFLCHVLPDSEVMDALLRSAPNDHLGPQTFTIRTWFRCVLFIHQGNTHGDSAGKRHNELMELTRIVFKLPEMKSYFAKEPQPSRTEPLAFLSVFIQGVEKSFGQLHSLADRTTLVSRALAYLGDFLKPVRAPLGQAGPTATLHLTYQVAGWVVRYWAPLLATSRGQQLLFSLLDTFLLPCVLLRKTPSPPSSLLSALRSTFSDFLLGISAVLPQVPYLQQQLQSLVKEHLFRAWPPRIELSGPQSSSPFLEALRLASQRRSHLSSNHFLKHLLIAVRNNFLPISGTSTPSNLSATLSFIQQVTRTVPPADLVSCEQHVLPSLLRVLLLTQEPRSRLQCVEILRGLLESCRNEPSSLPPGEPLQSLRDFVAEYEHTHEVKLHSVLEAVAAHSPSFVRELIPKLTAALHRREHDLGRGRDHSHRQAYCKLLSLLGEAGREEMKLITEDS